MKTMMGNLFVKITDLTNRYVKRWQTFVLICFDNQNEYQNLFLHLAEFIFKSKQNRTKNNLLI